MRLTVWVPDWQLEEDQRVLSVGEELSSWLTFEEGERVPGAPERLQVVRGVARPLPSWPGAELHRHPVRVDVAGGALYWDAPAPVDGPFEILGSVSTCVTDAPDGFPTTRLVIRAARMLSRRRGVHEGGLFLSGAPAPRAVPGAARTDWSGVLLDVEAVGLVEA
jgi:hypothetical protein